MAILGNRQFRPRVLLAVLLPFAIPVWIFFAAPTLKKLPTDFRYTADIFSIDNFFDEAKQQFLGPQISKTKFTYEVAESKRSGNALIIKNVFDVRKLTEEKIFAVSRNYAIDALSGRHLSGLGDHDREGYLFAPRWSWKRPYTYWHINYDAPARMLFQGAENLDGLKVYRFAADYHADQTRNLGFLPGVPATRGVNLTVNLQVWIEPVSGALVKYEDNTVAYYYNIKSGKRIAPWNKFRNRHTDSSLQEHVRLAQREKWKIIGIDVMVPVLLALGAILTFFPGFLIRAVGAIHASPITSGELPLQGRRHYWVAAMLLLIIVISAFWSSQKQKPIVMGVAQWGVNPDYEQNVKGFKDALAAKGYKENVRFLEGNAKADIEKQREIIESFVRADVSLIYSLTTPGTLAAKSITQTIPIVFSIVTYAVEVNLIHSLESSENNLVGTRNYISPAQQYFAFERIYPHTRTLAFVHRAGEPNSAIQLNQFKQLLSEREIALIDIAVVDIQDIKTQLDDHAQKIDTLFLSCDTLVQAGGEAVAIAFEKEHVKPVFTCNSAGVYKGALMGDVADLYIIGKMAGEKAALILNGAEPRWLHTESQPNENILINQKMADDLGLVIPSDLRAIASSIITK